MNLMLNLRAVKGRAFPRVIGALREPSWMFWEVFLPLLSISAFIYVYRSLNAPREFEGFVVLGGVMTTYWLNVLWGMASQLFWEKETANLQLYLAAPMSKMSILAGMAIGGIFMTTVRAIMIVFIGVYVFKVNFVITEPVTLASVFVITLIAMYGLGMVFASLFLMWGREAWNLSSLFQEPIFFLSGQNFPISALGPLISAAASFIPLTLGLDAMRQLLFPSMSHWGLLDPSLELFILSIMSILMLYMARFFLNFVEQKGKEKGTLTMRWQ